MNRSTSSSFWAPLRRELSARVRLLQAAFGTRPTAAINKLTPPPASGGETAAQSDLLAGLNTAAETAGVQVWDWDIERNTLKFNRNVARVYDTDADYAENNPRQLIEQAIHPDDLPHYRENFIQALKGKRSLDIQYRVRQKSGAISPVRLVGEVHRGESGRATRVIGITVDMSEHAEREARIAAQAQRQQELLERIALANETANVGMWDWDLTTGKLSSDTNMSAIFKDADLSGVTRAEDFVTHILHPDDHQNFIKTMRAAVAQSGGEQMSIRFRYRAKDGGVQHAHLHGRILRNEQGMAMRFLGVSRNVTAQVKADEEITRQSLEQKALVERLNLAAQVAGIDVWEWDLLTDRFTADAHLTAAYGQSRVEFESGRSLIRAIVHPDDVDAYLHTIERALQSGDSMQHRYRLALPDGTLRHVQVQARIFRDANGAATRMLGVSIDRTDEIAQHEALHLRAEQERALRDRLNLATETARIAIWDQDMLVGGFTGDARFWELFGIDANADFRLQEGIHPDSRKTTLAPLYAAFTDPSKNDVLSVRHRTSNPKRELQYVQSHMRLFRDEHGKVTRLVGVTWDVTEEMVHAEQLKHAADQERALVQRLNITTQAAGISPWEFDIKANQFSWHGMRQPAYGLDDVPLPEYLDALRGIILEEDLPQLTEPAVNAVRNKVENYSYKFRVRGKDGQIHHMHNNARLLRDVDGKYRYIMGVTLDVTQEVEAKQQIARQAEKERALIERLNVSTQAAGISPWEFDLKRGCFSWHGPRPACFEMDDVPLEDYYATLTERILPEDRHQMIEPAREAITSGRDFYQYRFRFRDKHGNLHHMHNYGRILKSERGNIRYCVGVTWDITKEVEATEQLEKRAEENRQLVERLNIATDAAGIGSWEMDLVAQRFMWVDNPIKILGMAPEDFGALDDFAEHVVPEDRHLLPQNIKQAVVDGSLRMGFRYRAYDLNGNIIHVQTFGRVFVNDANQPVRALGVSWDVTNIVEAEEKLRAQAQQERALTERLGFALEGSGMSLWEFDLKINQYIWTGRRLPILGLDDVPVEKFYEGISKLILPEDYDHIHAVPREAAASGKPGYSVRYRVRGKDGEIHHLRNSVRFLRSASGRPYRMVGITWDVTEEVQINERLQAQAQQERKLLERLNIATDAAGISSWEIDLVSRKFLWIENPLASVRRPEDGDDLARSVDYFSERMLPEDRPLMSIAIRDALAAKTDRLSYRYRVVGVNGEIVHIQTFARLILDESDTAVRVLGVSWDVTPEVEAAEQLRHQTERLRDVERRLERASLSSSEGHWEAEIATGHLWCSSSFHTLLGYLEGEIDNRVSALDRLVHADDRQTYLDALREHLTNNAKFDVEARLRSANGDYRWFRLRGMAERNAEGQPTLIAGSIHDIHQQKEIEDAFKLAQRRFERAINGTQDGLWELDVASGDTWCSPRLALLLGYAPQAMEGKNFLVSLIHPDDAEKVLSATGAHYRHNHPFDVEVRLKNRGGEYRWYRARATAERDAENRAVRLSGSLQDVTEARAAREELLRATEAAEAASRAKSAFLANVSHEIRTPMNGIIGMTGLMLETQLDRTQRDYADTIRGSADALLAVINDILDFSKIEAGKLEIENIDMDLRTHIEDIGATMAFQAASKGLELIVNVQPDVPDRVKGDPQRLRQCLINLLGNAIKFTKQGEIVLDVCAVGRHEGRVLTHFEVRDTGTGIPAHVVPTLFQPFVQADSSTTRHFGGTGLGLSIVRRLIEMMGGQVGVVSDVGKGSTFFFTLSLEPSENSTTMPVIASAHGKRILIVDDNATNRRVLGDQLTHAGYTIASANDGASALQILEQAHAEARGFDAVVADYQMPDMDGAMMGERINANPRLSNTRLVALTSLDRQGDAQRFRGLGFAAYMTKPVRSRELLDCMQRVLAGEARQWQMESQPMITRGVLNQLDAQQRFKGKILLVEDNLVNQKVASRYLERMGCTVRIAHNGLEGVNAFEEDSFDLIFMDVQMPVMDGLTATGKIREIEATQPRNGRALRTPIVALTANAMRGDQERCEAAGMDSFLTKPIEIERLREILDRFGLGDRALTSTGKQAAHQPQAAKTDDAPPPLALARLNEITDGDAEFARELIDTFLTSAQEQIQELHAALSKQDRAELARSAHKIKGACANIHALGMRDLSYKLEAESKTLSEAEASELLKNLETEFARLKEFVNDPAVMPAAARVAS